MKKKLPGSLRTERLVTVNSEDIFNKPLTKRQQAVVNRHAERQAAGDESHINFTDIPPLPAEQLAGMIRLRHTEHRPKRVAQKRQQ
jgi:hypothetical protein